MDSSDLKSLPVSSVDELLRYVSGVNLNVRSQFGVQADIGMRGSTFSQVLVLLDNVRINGPLTGHFNNNIPLGMAEIARIEIIRGPASASYGADAVGVARKSIFKSVCQPVDVLGVEPVGSLPVAACLQVGYLVLGAVSV